MNPLLIFIFLYSYVRNKWLWITFIIYCLWKEIRNPLLLISESKKYKNTKIQKSRCKLKCQRNKHSAAASCSIAQGWAEAWHHWAFISFFPLTPFLLLCLRLEHSATWNARPWLRKVSKRFLMKRSSPFSTPRKRRNTAPSVTAAVRLSEVAWDPPPPHLWVRMAANLCDWPSSRQKGGNDQRGSPFTPRLAPPPWEPLKHSTPVSQLPRPPCQPEQSMSRTLWEAEPRFRPAPLLTVLETRSKAILHFTSPSPVNVKLIRNHRRKTKRGTQFLYWWPYLMSFTKHETTIRTNPFFWICCSTYVSYIHLYYVKKFTNLPLYSGLTNPYQISLKTKGFICISIFSMFLPKLLEATGTSECLITRKC